MTDSRGAHHQVRPTIRPVVGGTGPKDRPRSKEIQAIPRDLKPQSKHLTTPKTPNPTPAQIPTRRPSPRLGAQMTKSEQCAFKKENSLGRGSATLEAPGCHGTAEMENPCGTPMMHPPPKALHEW
ncbi:hypothetical protein CRENBAI_012147 [Crenichthys baileyi]|uniref:Uncharacterized protein n=1 Tax=Crenichthys baileyi TaxID=28760 RepID=A0AAV9QWJ0_9TELE